MLNPRPSPPDRKHGLTLTGPLTNTCDVSRNDDKFLRDTYQQVTGWLRRRMSRLQYVRQTPPSPPSIRRLPFGCGGPESLRLSLLVRSRSLDRRAFRLAASAASRRPPDHARSRLRLKIDAWITSKRAPRVSRFLASVLLLIGIEPYVFIEACTEKISDAFFAYHHVAMTISPMTPVGC